MPKLTLALRDCIFFIALLPATFGAGCSDETKAAADTGPLFVFDSSIAKPDVPDVPPPDDTNETDAGPEADVPPDNPFAAVLAQAATPTLDIATKTTLIVTVQPKIGDPVAPTAKQIVTFQVDGAALAVGADFPPEPLPQPAVSVWKTGVPGQYLLAGVRPGKASVVALVDGMAADPITIDVAQPTGKALARVTTPSGLATTVPTRVAHSPDTIRLDGKKAGADTMSISLRFPSTANAGDVFDIEKQPPVGELKVTMPDFGGTTLTMLKGRLWLDQVDKGMYRGSFLGLSADLKPMAGLFAAERDGKFGVDISGDPVTIELSSAPEPATGMHVSRATVSAIGNGKAMLLYRRIKNVGKADLVRVVIDAATGELDKSLPPLVIDAPAQQDEVPVAALGWSAAAVSAGQTIAVWEGHKGKASVFGQNDPNLLWYRTIADNGALGEATVVAEEDCVGECRPQVIALPNSRWLIAWQAPGGQGIRVRRLEGNLTWAEDKPVQLVQPPGAFVSVASLDANLAVAWSSEAGAMFRLYSDVLVSNGPEDHVGADTDSAPRPEIVAMLEPAPSFLTVFLTGSPANKLQFRRIGLNASKLGTGDVTLASDVDRFVAAAGKPGQVAIVDRIAKLKAGADAFRVRKIAVAGAADPGAALAGAITLPSKSKSAQVSLFQSMCYVPEADVFVVVWSGNSKSEGVWLQRFR